jgi:hypothetical protein
MLQVRLRDQKREGEKERNPPMLKIWAKRRKEEKEYQLYRANLYQAEGCS